MSVGLALIAKNEEKNLPVLLESIKDSFDQVALVDTGSKDKTVRVFSEWVEAEKARNEKFEGVTGTYEWDDNFAAARNHADSLLSTQWKVWADCDDEIKNARNIRQVVTQIPPEVAAMMAGYLYARDEYENCICYHYRERIVRNDGASNWDGRVHEAQLIHGPTGKLTPDILEWVHRKPLTAEDSSKRNLRILRKWVKDEPENTRVLAYLGTEEMVRGRAKQAYPYFRRYLKLQPGWDEERAQVHRKYALCLLQLGRFKEARETAHAAIDVLPSWVDSYLTLAQVTGAEGEFEKSLYWTDKVLEMGQPETMLIINPLDYNLLPRIVKSQALLQLGRLEESAAAMNEALELRPGDNALRQQALQINSALHAESTVSTWAGCAQLLMQRDEQLKALRILEDCVPYYIDQHPRIVALRSMLRERVRPLVSLSGQAEHYAVTDNEQGTDDISICEKLPRAQFLNRGLMEQSIIA